jgi:hypothetical protein
VAEFDSSSNALALLPNYAYVLPMARLRLEQAAAAAAAGAGATTQQQQGPLAGPGSGVSSLTLLAQALLLHPFVFNDLLGKLQGQGAAREEAWQQLAKRKLFAKVGVDVCVSFCCCQCCCIVAWVLDPWLGGGRRFGVNAQKSGHPTQPPHHHDRRATAAAAR